MPYLRLYANTECFFPPADSNEIEEMLLPCVVDPVVDPVINPVVVDSAVVVVFVPVATDAVDDVLFVSSSSNNAKSIISGSVDLSKGLLINAPAIQSVNS